MIPDHLFGRISRQDAVKAEARLNDQERALLASIDGAGRTSGQLSRASGLSGTGLEATLRALEVSGLVLREKKGAGRVRWRRRQQYMLASEGSAFVTAAQESLPPVQRAVQALQTAAPRSLVSELLQQPVSRQELPVTRQELPAWFDRDVLFPVKPARVTAPMPERPRYRPEHTNVTAKG